MPKVFKKDCKIKLIEYGSSANDNFFWKSFKKDLQNLVSTTPILKLIKRNS